MGEDDQGCCPTDIDAEEVLNKVRNWGKRTKSTKSKKAVGKFCFTGVTKKNVEDDKTKFTEGVKSRRDRRGRCKESVGSQVRRAGEEDGEVCIKCEAKCSDDDCADKVQTTFKDKDNAELKKKLPDTTRRGRKLAPATLPSADGSLTTT